MKFYTSVEKGLDLKFKKFCGLIPMFVEVTEEKLVGGGGFFCPLPPILNSAKTNHAVGITTGPHHMS